jgi:LacI family transcriptional regulator
MPPASRTTLQAIADQLGISTTTVSRALSGQAGRYRISPKTEKAVQELARSLGFVPSQLARELRLKKTLTIGLVIPDVSNPFFAGIARQVTLGAHEQGYSIVLCDSQESVEQEIQAIELLRTRQVQGVIVCPVGQSAEHLAEVQRRGLPLVLVDRVFPELPLPYVTSDNLAAAREATEYLIVNGHRRIACLQGLRGTSPNELRLRGFRQAMAEHGVPVDESLIVGDSFGERGGYLETKRLLHTPGSMTAILAFSNLIALGALRAIAEAGLAIPEAISIVAFDDQPYAAHLAAPMTTVTQAYSEMGEIAVKLLFDQIREPQAASEGGILLPARLVVRQSVKKLE